MPSPTEKLQKFIRLEAERGYDNRAVVGGLDKILPSWEKEARSTKISDEIIDTVLREIHAYPGLSPDARSACLNGLLTLLQSVPSEPAGGGEKPQRAPHPPRQPTSAAEFQHPANSRPQPTLRTAPPPGISQRSTPSSSRSSDSDMAAGLNAPLTVLQGIGNKHAQTLKELDLETLGDLLYYFPRRYDDYSNLKPINRLVFGEELTVIGTIQSVNTRPFRGGQSQMTEAVVTDGTGFLRVTWFNQPWVANKLNPGTQVVLSGRIEQYLGRLVMNSPDWELVEQEHLHTNRIVPVYPLTARITQRWLRRMMYQTVSFWAPRVQDYLPAAVREQAGVIDLGTALSQVHFPNSDQQLKVARDRLAFDEIFLLQMGVLRQKRNWQSNSAQVFAVEDSWLETQLQQLPFQLTNAQLHALSSLRADLASGRPMNRLLQGDVGSGKTIVAALAVAIITANGAQAAVMAPTSILAEQHYRNLSRVLSNAETPEAGLLQPEQIRLLVGDTSESDKQQIRDGLASGDIKLVIGTHALIEDPVTFQRLQLVVIDEQHRFGVAQRSQLRAKGENPHLLVMTATPIPRSLALTLYGDLDLAVMDEMPVGRIPVETHVLSPFERERAYHLIKSQIAEGHQAFIIYPLVEKGERSGDEDRAAVEEHARLQKEVFAHHKLGLLHGRLKPEEKEEVMARFRDREFDVLVSTSVVEVGVDVPNATVMLVEGANRFGLAQLHQFRGRVGRGQDKSYCLLIPDGEDKLENERLMVMAETNDGFVLAERDLQQRGPGDFLGTRQAGFMELKMANITDVRLIEKAREQAQAVFEVDPDLTLDEHKPLLKTLNRFWGGGKGDIS